jgi:alpha-beta hydrolase superfamily lysophospholipase
MASPESACDKRTDASQGEERIATSRLKSALPILNISHNFYPGGRHEMLNEINRDEVRALLLGWISGRFNELPSRKDAGC